MGGRHGGHLEIRQHCVDRSRCPAAAGERGAGLRKLDLYHYPEVMLEST